MSEIAITSHNFESAKSQLKAFSEQISPSVAMQTVATKGGLFNLFNHKVTGEELNQLTAKVQQHIMTVNGVLIETVKEFDQVYTALEALDQDYIQGIILSIKAAEEASHQAKSAADQAKRNTVDLAKAIEVLKKFKADIERLKHLVNVDDLWQQSQEAKLALEVLEKKYLDLEGSFARLDGERTEQTADINRRLRMATVISITAVSISVATLLLSVFGIV